jgi:hypothetical protein
MAFWNNPLFQRIGITAALTLPGLFAGTAQAQENAAPVVPNGGETPHVDVIGMDSASASLLTHSENLAAGATVTDNAQGIITAVNGVVDNHLTLDSNYGNLAKSFANLAAVESAAPGSLNLDNAQLQAMQGAILQEAGVGPMLPGTSNAELLTNMAMGMAFAAKDATQANPLPGVSLDKITEQFNTNLDVPIATTGGLSLEQAQQAVNQALQDGTIQVDSQGQLTKQEACSLAQSTPGLKLVLQKSGIDCRAP